MLRSRKRWNVDFFNQINLPEIVGMINPEIFSRFSGIRVLDMPIHMPGQGWKIPNELNQFAETICRAIIHESKYENIDHNYCYITIDQKIVQEGKTGRRSGAHSDAYIETEGSQIDITPEYLDVIGKEIGEVSHTYVICDKFPTEFFDIPFPLIDMSCEGSLNTFDEISETANPITYPPYMLLKMDPYVVHRCAICMETTERTFVKISFSKKRYARKGNTINEEFNYDWEMTARSPSERNHPWS